MWKEALLLFVIILAVEIGYRVVDYFIYRLNNIAGEIDEEE
jgi:hypothetical protein